MRPVLAVAILALLALAPAPNANDAARFTDWSAPVRLGEAVNTTSWESCVGISKDALTLLYSHCGTCDTTMKAMTRRDLYVATRRSANDAWETRDPLSALNSGSVDMCPTLSSDEHRLYFASRRSGGCGGIDIWVAQRRDRRDPLGWEAPVNLGCAPGGPNSNANDMVPTLFEDEAGRVVMYFASNRAGQLDHYQAVMNDDDTFGPATPIAELNSAVDDQGIAVRRDGLEVIFLSKRPGGGGSSAVSLLDFWSATRASTADAWSEPAFVSSLGTAWALGKIGLSFDGRELYFASYNQPTTGGEDLPDIWVARREKLE